MLCCHSQNAKLSGRSVRKLVPRHFCCPDGPQIGIGTAIPSAESGPPGLPEITDAIPIAIAAHVIRATISHPPLAAVAAHWFNNKRTFVETPHVFVRPRDPGLRRRAYPHCGYLWIGFGNMPRKSTAQGWNTHTHTDRERQMAARARAREREREKEPLVNKRIPP
jgi:hypothetical protein